MATKQPLQSVLTKAAGFELHAAFRSDRANADRSSSCTARDRKSTRLNSSHSLISYAVFCLKKNKNQTSSVGSDPKPPRRLPDLHIRLRMVGFPGAVNSQSTCRPVDTDVSELCDSPRRHLTD